MRELLFFILGMAVDGLAMTTLMCRSQINRINEIEARCLKLENEKFEVQYEN